MLPEYFSYFAILVGILGIGNYIYQIHKGTTRPNIISWIFWSIAPIIGIYVSYKSGVAIPFLISTFVAGFMPAIVVVFALLRKNAVFKISKFDISCGIFSALAIIIWLTTKNPFLSLVFAILADLFAGIPTIIKSWKNSDSESIGPYLSGIINSIITFLIISNFTFVNYAFPLYLLVLNTIIIFSIKKNYFRYRLSSSYPK